LLDSGGYFIDTGTGPGGNTPTGASGSCTNPVCVTDGVKCGCTAKDSQGDAIALACLAGGDCTCIGGQQSAAFQENGACATSTATAQQFLQYCTCK
jgi:hypothetical protein